MKYVLKLNRFGVDEIVGVYRSELRAYKRFKALKKYYGKETKIKVVVER